ncbi:hypothetical protein KEM60_02013 [Austwickia sp. TVS 96-490-7B]|uniref:hypothetical protein n=1 Tax=Austwickia sp. TVS 96-490-7B TaxID=2830843 RepID=UPI001C58826A|nr:hypothetical protein [Austwickia sp. TVS 96-490-7B]MBW3085802.1 hypothetical protein [Austwickia sp. TVS 96-490-7B]
MTRRIAAIAALPLVLCGLSACGGSESTPSAVGPHSQGPDAALYTLCASSGQTLDRDAFNQAVKAVKVTTSHFALAMKVTDQKGAGGTVHITGDADASDPAAPRVHAFRSSPDQSTPIEMVLIGRSLFVRTGSEAFASVDPERMMAQTGLDFAQLSNPHTIVSKVKDALVTVTCMGRAQTGGAASAHLRLTIDAQRMSAAATTPAASASPSTPSTGSTPATGISTATSESLAKKTAARAAAPAASSPATSAAGTITWDTWVDQQGRPLKTSSTVSSAGMTATSEGTYTKLGEPVTIPTPTAAPVRPGGPTSAPAPSSTSNLSPQR